MALQPDLAVKDNIMWGDSNLLCEKNCSISHLKQEADSLAKELAQKTAKTDGLIKSFADVSRHHEELVQNIGSLVEELKRKFDLLDNIKKELAEMQKSLAKVQ